MMAIAHLTLWVRWAKILKKNCFFAKLVIILSKLSFLFAFESSSNAFFIICKISLQSSVSVHSWTGKGCISKFSPAPLASICWPKIVLLSPTLNSNLRLLLIGLWALRGEKYFEIESICLKRTGVFKGVFFRYFKSFV